MKSLQHLCSTIDNSNESEFKYIYFGIVDNLHYPATDSIWLYRHNEEGPFAIDLETKEEINWFLFDSPLTKKEWERQVAEIKFGQKFEELLTS